MERSRSKRNYNLDQDNETETMPRTRAKYNIPTHYDHLNSSHPRRGGRFSKAQDTSLAAAVTGFRILCPDCKAGGVIGKSGSIIKTIRHHTGAWISVHELFPGDEERIIEITDGRRRDPDGRSPSFSPSQEALLLVHDRILESDSEFVLGFDGGNEDDDYKSKGLGSGPVVSRLVVSRNHVGCLLGKGGKIIEQMRAETKTQIRVLPRDHNLPSCISLADEVVQITGEPSAVKHALRIISSRLIESQQRERGQFNGRLHSPEPVHVTEDDISFHSGFAGGHRSFVDEEPSPFNVLFMNGPSGLHQKFDYGDELGPSKASSMDREQSSIHVEKLVFRLLCPVNAIASVVDESNGIIPLLQNEVGVDVDIINSMFGSAEQMIIISSDEGPDDELFPAQEALLHIQGRLAEERNSVTKTTTLVVPSTDVGCLVGIGDSVLNTVEVRIVPREEVPLYISKEDELVQIAGEIRAARSALVEVTSRLRDHVYKELLQCDMVNGRAPPVPEIEEESVPTNACRLPVVTRSMFEIVVPDHVVLKLISRSRNRLAQFSELSGARVSLVEGSGGANDKVIQISGTPEQAQKAESLLQGFVLSTQEDVV